MTLFSNDPNSESENLRLLMASLAEITSASFRTDREPAAAPQSPALLSRQPQASQALVPPARSSSPGTRSAPSAARLSPQILEALAQLQKRRLSSGLSSPRIIKSRPNG